MKEPKIESNFEAKEEVPSFFKFLADDSLDYIPICRAFVKKYLEANYPNNPILMKTGSGQSWRVEIGRIGHKHCFLNGWLRFVKDNKLKTGDFLVFWLIADSTFQVAMYGPSCCQKIPNQRAKDQNQTSRGGHVMKKPNVEISDGSSAPESPPSCFRVITKSHKYQVPLTTRFAREAGIAGKRKVVLRDEKGKKWEAGGYMRNSSYYLTRGWFSFSKANNVQVGDTCVFTIPTPSTSKSILDVKVLRKHKMKRGREGQGSPFN